MRRERIELDSERDRWKWTCPRGHRSWEPTNDHFWCKRCAAGHDDADPVFRRLKNRATGEVVPREELVLVPPAGPSRDGQGGSA